MSSENESGWKAVQIICLTRRQASGKLNKNMKGPNQHIPENKTVNFCFYAALIFPLVKPSFPMMNGNANLTAVPPSNVLFSSLSNDRGISQSFIYRY